MVPKKFGDWIRTQAVSDVTDFSSSFRFSRPLSSNEQVDSGRF